MGELRFTGNWFIDAGILGFVNLMEEVYGWDLNELQRRIKEEPEKVYYGYFPLAYLFHHSVYHKYIKNVQDLKSQIADIRKRLRNVEDSLRALNKELSKSPRKMEKRLRKQIEKNEKKANELRIKIKGLSEKIYQESRFLEKERKDLQNISKNLVEELLNDVENNFENAQEYLSRAIDHYELQIPKDHRNFFLYNPKKNPVLAFRYLYWLLKMDYTKLGEIKRKVPTYEEIPDSTVNPFLYSPVEFPNVSYTKLLTVGQITKMLPADMPAYIVFLSFFNAFQWVPGGYVMVYTPDLWSCYSINKRLKIHIQSSSEQRTMFQLTWSAIIDEIVETKARFSLENLYIIEFENIENQKLKGVEYIGIPKLHASIILDDEIRDAINVSLKVGDSNIWILGEFIKQKPLYPLILRHVWKATKDNGFLNWKASIHALAIDAKIKTETTRIGIFDDSFFECPKRASIEVKDFYQDMMHVAGALKELSSEIDGKNLIHPLFSALRKHNRNAFVNNLLKALLQVKNKNIVVAINSYLFKHILTNDDSWEDFALALIVGLAGGGGNVEPGEIVED